MAEGDVMEQTLTRHFDGIHPVYEGKDQEGRPCLHAILLPHPQPDRQDEFDRAAMRRHQQKCWSKL